MSCCVAVLFVLGSIVPAGPGAWSGAEEADAASSVAESEIVPPQVIPSSQRPPVYPPAALAGRFEGVVEMRVTVGADGAVRDVQVVRCDHGQLGFEEASIAAARDWRFRPARRGGEAIEGDTTLRVAFRASGRGVERGAYVTAGGGSTTAEPVAVTSAVVVAKR
jgi:protein TonB